MAVMRALSALGRLVWRSPKPSADLLEAYAHEVVPVLDRAEWLYQYWLEQSTLFSDSEKLGNVAAIHRWETATMGRSLERVIPPAPLSGAHDGVLEALDLASRAAQLLSSGSRFHNANAVCEGQAMLLSSREHRLEALRTMRRYFSRTIPQAFTPAAAGETVLPDLPRPAPLAPIEVAEQSDENEPTMVLDAAPPVAPDAEDQASAAPVPLAPEDAPAPDPDAPRIHGGWGRLFREPPATSAPAPTAERPEPPD